MLSETVQFNVSVLVTRQRANGKSTAFPVITCRNKSVEIAAIGVAAGSTEKRSPAFVIAVKNSERGAVDIESAGEPRRVGSVCCAIRVGIAVVSEICIRRGIAPRQADRKFRGHGIVEA